MECQSPHYVALLRKLLDSGKTVVAPSPRKGGVIAEVKGRLDCEIREVTMANREKLVEELAGWITDHAGQMKCTSL